MPAPAEKNRLEIAMTGQFPYISGQERVIPDAFADILAGQEVMFFRRLQRTNLEFLAEAARTRSMRDRPQTTVLKHGLSRATHCYVA